MNEDILPIETGIFPIFCGSFHLKYPKMTAKTGGQTLGCQDFGQLHTRLQVSYGTPYSKI